VVSHLAAIQKATACGLVHVCRVGNSIEFDKDVFKLPWGLRAFVSVNSTAAGDHVVGLVFASVFDAVHARFCNHVFNSSRSLVLVAIITVGEGTSIVKTLILAAAIHFRYGDCYTLTTEVTLAGVVAREAVVIVGSKHGLNCFSLRVPDRLGGMRWGCHYLVLKRVVTMDGELGERRVVDLDCTCLFTHVVLGISARVFNLIGARLVHIDEPTNFSEDKLGREAAIGIHGVVSVNTDGSGVVPDTAAFDFLRVLDIDTTLTEVLGTTTDVVTDLALAVASGGSGVGRVAEGRSSFLVEHFALTHGIFEVVNTHCEAVGRSVLEELALVLNLKGFPSLFEACFGAGINAVGRDHLDVMNSFGESTFEHIRCARGTVDFRAGSVYNIDCDFVCSFVILAVFAKNGGIIMRHEGDLMRTKNPSV
jgi:hypothetical protein